MRRVGVVAVVVLAAPAAAEPPPACRDSRMAAPASLDLCTAQFELNQVLLLNQARHRKLAVLRRKLNKATFDALGCVSIPVAGGRHHQAYSCVSVEDDDPKSWQEEVAEVRAALKQHGLRALPCSHPDVGWLADCGENSPAALKKCEAAPKQALLELQRLWPSCRPPPAPPPPRPPPQATTPPDPLLPDEVPPPAAPSPSAK